MFLEKLRKVVWEENKHIQLYIISHRHALVIACSKRGKQKLVFANGEFPCSAYIQILNKNLEWNAYGNNIVPVLPDGRIIMIMEQRAILERYKNRLKIVELSGGATFDLGEIGSLEFPGGAVEPEEKIKVGALRELKEENGLENQEATLYYRIHPIYAFGSDIASANFFSVAHLSRMKFENYTPTDGGLTILALFETEIERNIRNGIIASGQAAMLAWGFYQEVKKARDDPKLLKQWTDEGYISIEKVRIE